MEHFDGQLIELSANGYSNLYVFKNYATVNMRLEKSTENVDDKALYELSKVVRSELQAQKRTNYQSEYQLSIEASVDHQSSTLTRLLQRILKRSTLEQEELDLVILLINNIVYSEVTKQYTPLQLGLANFLKKSTLIQELNKYKITCSYDEMQRLKSSIAIGECQETNPYGKSTPSNLIQIIVDNFDATISSQNGLSSTHSLGIIAAVTDLSPAANDRNKDDNIVKRVTWKEHKQFSIESGQDIDHYHGPKKTPMDVYRHNELSDELIEETSKLTKYASSLDYSFLSDILLNNDDVLVPEYNGYNTKTMRESGRSLNKKHKFSLNLLLT